jgi:hypothetical protein
VTILAAYDSAMGAFHSLRKVVKESSSSTCTRIIFVEDNSDGIAVKVNEYLTDWVKPFPNTSQKVSSRPRHSLEDAEVYASYLFGVSLLDGFVQAR